MAQLQKNMKGIIYITIKKIENIYNKPITTSSINLQLENLINTSKQRSFVKQIGQISNRYNPSKGNQLNWVTICDKKDKLNINLQFNSTSIAYLSFPLQKMIEMPRVKHAIDCKLVLKQNNQIKKPIVQVVSLQLQIIYLNNLLGRYIINQMQANLTRNTQLIGKMDPFVQIKYMDKTYKTNVKEDEGTKCLWEDKIQIPIKFDSIQGMKMIFSIFDKDNFTNDLVGSKNFNLSQDNFLMPTQQSTKKSFMIYYDGKEAGNVTIKYQFVIAPYNF